MTIVRTSVTPMRGSQATLYHLSDGQELKAFELMVRYDPLLRAV